jgi:hypothetical protein
MLILLLGAPAHAGTRCSATPARGPVGLADTIYVKGACGTFALRPDGSVRPAHPPGWAPRWAGRALARADARTYVTHTRGHLVLLRGGRTLWRSRLPHGSDNVSINGDAIAFTAYEHYHPDVWVAHLGRPEQLAARTENLLGSARGGGFFTQRGHDLRVRDADGLLRRHLATVYATAYDARTETLVALTDVDRLIRTDGSTVKTLDILRDVGHAWPSWLDVLPNGLIEIQSTNRRFFFSPDGRRFASAVLPRKAIDVSGTLSLADRRGVVFAIHHGGSDRVLLLERGDRIPRELYRRRVAATGCGYRVNLSLRGDQVLYWSSPGRALVELDTMGRMGAHDLWPIVHRIPGFRGHGRIYRANWASAWNS